MLRLTSMALLVLAAAAPAAFVKQPYLQNVAESSMVVRWETAARQTGFVEFGLTAEYGLGVGHSDSAIDHELTLTGLAPDTAYHFRVISGQDTSPDRVFRSCASAGQGFRFAVLGDPHGDSSVNQRVADRLALVAPGPAFVISTGDLTGDGKSVSYRKLLNTQQAWMSRAPLMAAPGNHDYDSIPNWYRFLCQPGNERWFGFRFGNSSFHCVDAYDSLLPGSPQYDRLLAGLQADSAEGVHHSFVLVHTPAYTTSTVYSGNADIRQQYCPLFERYGVEVAFSGHVHAYEHSLVNGVHYITTGGGGATLSTGWNAAQPWTVYREAVYEFVLVDVRGDTITTRGVRTDGTEFDSLVLVRNLVALAENRGAGPVARLAFPTVVSAGEGRVRFGVRPVSQQARIEVYDAAGQRVASMPASGSVTWEFGGAGAGLYFVRLWDGMAPVTRKLLLTN